MSCSGILLRSEDIELVREAFNSLLKFLVFGFATFECARGFLSGVETGLESGIGSLKGLQLVLPLQWDSAVFTKVSRSTHAALLILIRFNREL